MPISQNLMFSGKCPADSELEHPPGASIAKLLQSELANRGWKTEPLEDWRDGGWSIECSRNAGELEVVVAAMWDGEGEPDEWFLQISPSYVPGLIATWFGKKVASADPLTIHTLAQDAHAILSEKDFKDFRWCWDGPPDPGNSTAEPVAPEQHAIRYMISCSGLPFS